MDNEIITKGEIEKILDKYNIGKKPLAKLLGWGEVTIIRYLAGDVPTRLYSAELLKILNRPKYLNEILEKNKKNISDVAYRNVKNALQKLLGENNSEIDKISAYFINNMSDITPAILNKMLYYANGFSYAFFDFGLFLEECQAANNGPLYTSIENDYKDKENIPIDTNLSNCDILNNETKLLLNVIIDCFGYYNNYALTKMTCYEEPWLNARDKKELNENSNLIGEDIIRNYFIKVKEKYDMLNIWEIIKYSEDQFKSTCGLRR